MNIKRAFRNKKTLFIPFLMAGYPEQEMCFQTILNLETLGCDILEIGVPFSDPIADGPVNQRAAHIALTQDITLQEVLNLIKKLRQANCQLPIILFTYYNPILAYGETNFFTAAVQSGVDGILVVDLPPEEGFQFYQTAKQHALEIVLLASPTTDPTRYPIYHALSPSFIYYISRLAVTGEQQDLSQSLTTEIRHLKQYFPQTPIAVGFGIAEPKQAKTVAKIADGVIVGSKLIHSLTTMSTDAFNQLIQDFIHEIASSA